IHITVGHLLCQLTDHFLFENVLALQPHLEGQTPG
ncbi:MAG TPA: phosphoheptose isomerase, partial [Desulfovibrio sp.]|nr:phosphoheptose isomerase [Desulfovibrio sp.]